MNQVATPNKMNTDFQGQGLLAEWSWAIYEWARNPYVLLITIYIFAPYFANQVVGDPILGQAYLGYSHGVAGFIVAFSAPIIGSIADKMGSRKLPLGIVSLCMVPVMYSLWYVTPENEAYPHYLVLIAIGFLTVAYEYTAVFHNSLLVIVTDEKRVGFVSGLGLSLGNLGGLLMLLFMILCIVLPNTPLNSYFFVADSSFFGLDPSKFEDSRFAGPITAVWLLVFLVPLMFFVSEKNIQKMPLKKASVAGFEQLWHTLKLLPAYKNIGVYLLARMFFNDGKTAIIIFGGVYAAGIFSWGALELLIYGIVLSIFAVFGGFLASFLDNKLGAKATIIISIAVTIIFTLLLLFITPHSIYFMPVTTDFLFVDSPFINTLPEQTFILTAIFLAIFITSAYASSRSLMARIVPLTMATEFFGLYALSGTATTFLGPLMVGLFTDFFQSQAVGLGSVIILLVIGFFIMFWVKEERTKDATIEPWSNEQTLDLLTRWFTLFTIIALVLSQLIVFWGQFTTNWAWVPSVIFSGMLLFHHLQNRKITEILTNTKPLFFLSTLCLLLLSYQILTVIFQGMGFRLIMTLMVVILITGCLALTSYYQKKLLAVD